MEYTLDSIVKALKDKNYLVYTNPYRLNVVGIRNAANTSSSFDDKIAFFWYDDKDSLKGKITDATTDPNVMYLNKPINVNGTAILKSGQYVDSYKLGLHKSKYQALVQTKPVTVIRDADRNSLLNFMGKTQTGIFGINIHKAGVDSKGNGIIDSASAGCQVFKNVADFNSMMAAAQKSRDKYGNVFTYTLLDEKDFQQKVVKSTLYVGILLLAASAFFFIKKNNIQFI